MVLVEIVQLIQSYALYMCHVGPPETGLRFYRSKDMEEQAIGWMAKQYRVRIGDPTTAKRGLQTSRNT
jgi:hypothetical protein